MGGKVIFKKGAERIGFGDKHQREAFSLELALLCCRRLSEDLLVTCKIGVILQVRSQRMVFPSWNLISYKLRKDFWMPTCFASDDPEV